MMHTIITVYTTFSDPINIVVNESWNPSAIVHMSHVLIDRSHRAPASHVLLYRRVLPGNRFIVHRLNEFIFSRALQLTLHTFKHIRVLWMRSPRDFQYHNTVRYDYLVLGCAAQIAADRTKPFLYKDYFRKGWVFVYRIKGAANQTAVFKQTSETDILKRLQSGHCFVLP